MKSKSRVRSRWVTWALIAGLMPAAGPVMAQSPDPGPRPPRPGLEEDESAREEIQETIEIYMLARMKRTLRLTDEQERKVVPLVSDLNAVRHEANRSRRLTMMKLHPMIEDETTKDSEILALLDDLEEIDTRVRQKEINTRAELRSTLTPRQQVLFIGFMERFRHEMEDRLRRIQRGDNGPGPDGGPMRVPPQKGWPRPRR